MTLFRKGEKKVILVYMNCLIFWNFLRSECIEGVTAFICNDF